MASVILSLHLDNTEDATFARGPHTFTLEAGDPRASPGESLTFRATKSIHRGHSRVFRGLLSGGEYHNVKVVCKLATMTEKTRRRFQREAEVYQTKLRDMQAYYIPRFYGLYTGSILHEPTVCLVLEDCGTSLANIADLSMEWRYVLSLLK